MQNQADNNRLKTIGKNVKKLRQSNREKMETLAKALATSTGKLSQVENGLYPNLTIPFMESVARHYSVTLEYLL